MEAVAKLKNCPISPRKMRMVADLVRGEKVERALGLLKFEPKVGSEYIEKVLLSAISNWQNKNEDENVDGANLYIKTLYVDQGRTLKRLRPAPQGRAHRIRKRSNHITLVVDAMVEEAIAPEKKETKKEEAPKKASPKKAEASAKKAAPKASSKVEKKETNEKKK